MMMWYSPSRRRREADGSTMMRTGSPISEGKISGDDISFVIKMDSAATR